MLFNSPKNFKRGRFINNRYRVKDILLATLGVVVTLCMLIIYLIFLDGKNIFIMILITLPAATVMTLIMPFSIYHNFLEFLKLRIIYSRAKKRYIWEGIYKYRIVENDEDKWDV